jgi:hypothetical protein
MNDERWSALFDPTQSPALYIVGTAALTVVITVFYDTVKTYFGLLGAQLLAVLLAVLAVLAIIYPLLRRWRQERVLVQERERPSRCTGLIVLVSPSIQAAEAVAVAVAYHRPMLKHLWLIGTTGSSDEADKHMDRYGKGMGLAVYWDKDYLVNPDSIEDTYHTVKRILAQEAPRYGVAPDAIIADLTGGQKPMSVGMALACMEYGCALQYVKSRRTPTGQVDTSVIPQPILINTRQGIPDSGTV